MYAADGISGSVTSNWIAVIAARARLCSVHTGYVFFGTLVTSSDCLHSSETIYALWNRSYGANLCVCVLHYGSNTVTYRHVFVTVNLNRVWLQGL